MRKITVKGMGSASVKPDLIVLSLDLKTQLDTYEETMEEAADSSQKLVEAIVEKGFEKDDLKTTHFSVDTVYESYQDDQRNWRRRFSGYECQQSFRLEFEMDFERLSQVLSAITYAPIMPVFNIQFTVKDSNKVSKELLRSATENAKEKAEVLADAAGFELGEIVDIDYNWGRIDLYSPMDYQMYEAAPRMAEATPHIVPEDIDVSDTVTFVWEIH